MHHRTDSRTSGLEMQQPHNTRQRRGGGAGTVSATSSDTQVDNPQTPILVRAIWDYNADIVGPAGYEKLPSRRNAVFYYVSRIDGNNEWGQGVFHLRDQVRRAFDLRCVEKVRNFAEDLNEAALRQRSSNLQAANQTTSGLGRVLRSAFVIGLFRLLSVCSVFLNISLWIFLGVQTAQKDGWFKENHEKKLGIAASVCAAVMLATGIVVWLFARHPSPKLTTSQVVDSLNGLLCFGLPLIYLFTGAFPQYYDQPKWELTTQYVDIVPAPGFAVLGGYGDAAAAHIIQDWMCKFPWNKNCSQAWNKGNDNLNLQFYGNLIPYMFNGTGNSTLSFNHTSDDLVLQLEVNYDHASLQKSYGDPQNYATSATQSPYLFASMFDARLSDLASAIDCGLIALTELPALASNTLMFTASYVVDDLDMMVNTLAIDDEDCKETFKKAYEFHDPPYTSYTFHAATMPITDTTLCDNSTSSGALCVMQNILRLEKHVIEQMESVPGVEPKDIWLNVAAIVGGVQFLAWWALAFIEAVHRMREE